MSETRIGGVVVASGATIYWAALANIAAASWIYSAILGIIGVIDEIGTSITALTSGYAGFIVDLIAGTFRVLSTAARASLVALLESVQGYGPFAFPVVIGVVVLMLLLIARGIQW